MERVINRPSDCGWPCGHGCAGCNRVSCSPFGRSLARYASNSDSTGSLVRSSRVFTNNGPFMTSPICATTT
ncbi:unnamed protein product [Mycena citricolor]|uniref:Uncharacterized protein n=1 Tax=Mycena citricolor TaxID=2018698 RepID=A0AAD2HTC8_9AGAR|nr:unnamed protein product [Mycena citricolor]CAK5264429.1 unnamed protein product [Mycena citricolor]CAK5280655.1 unnamed protein product [Mycena citricolor]